MNIVNVYQIKTNLSYFLKLVQKGQKVIIAKRNVPIAQLTPIETKTPRIIGGYKGQFNVPESFFEPLPKSVIKPFAHPA